MICFICVTPTTVEMLVDGEMHVVKDVLLRQFSDTRSLFLGMFIAILSVEVYCWLENRNGLKIKMPDTVPPNVAASFSALIPAIITTTTIATFGFIFHQITGMYLYDAVYQVVQQPLERVVQSLPGILLLMFVAQLFWVIGIHGNQMIKPIREPLLLGAITVNMTAFEQGKEIPNIITMPFWDVYMSIGGSGLTIGLANRGDDRHQAQRDARDCQALDWPWDLQHQRAGDLRDADHAEPDSGHSLHHHAAGDRLDWLFCYRDRFRG